MGSCFSKKKVSSSSATVKAPIEKHEETIRVEEKKLEQPKVKIAKQKEEESLAAAVQKKEKEEEQVLPKKEVFVIKHRKSHDRERPNPSPPQIAVAENDNVVEIAANSGVRTSSCTKEEVDAILIQCGRLSRSNSSGKAISSGRKYAGSKRSFDFDHPDNESDPANADRELKRKDEEEVAEGRQHRQRNRQSPSKGRRRTPSREREQQQRSGSRERSSSTGNGRRVSRSPARRSENSNSQPAAPNSANNTSNNTGSRPGKMVSVPATVSIEKTSNGGTDSGVKRITVKRNVSETAVAGSRSAASPRRSRSPARANPRGCTENQQPSLSRSNSRKADQSPYRRNPGADIDPTSRKTEISPYRRNPLSEIDPNKLQYPQSTSEISKKQNAEMKMKEQIQPALTRSRSARRSRDLDINPEALMNPVAPNSYTSLLLEDIHNFHQKSTAAAPAPASFSLPACVSKACSIVEAVADLNSTTSSNLSIGRKPGEGKDPFVDLMEPSFHKYVTVKRGGDMEEQESSGSNSFVSSGQHWGYSSSSWEPNSAESTDRWSREEEGSRERNGIGRGRLTPAVGATGSL